MLRPCSRCDACLVRSREDWAFRLKQEWKVAGSAFFITLTYDWENLPIEEVIDPETGVVMYAACVDKSAMQGFLREYRRNFPPKDVRFYGISEYGKERLRPHYHLIMFHKGIYDFTEIERIVRKIWHSPEIAVGTLDEGAVVYCTTYCLTRKSIPPYLVPNFRLMSRKPGIGYNYIQSTKDWHLSGEKFYVVDQNGFKQNLPRYYRDRIFSEDQRSRHCEDTETETVKRNETFIKVDCNGDPKLAYRKRREAIIDYHRRISKTLEKKKPTNL